MLSFRYTACEYVKPGQFFNIKITELHELFLRRPFSVHDIHRDNIKIIYKVVGKGTELLSGKKSGELLDIIGPLGNGFNLDLIPSYRNLQVILVGGGYGVSPLYALGKYLLKHRVNLVTLIGASTWDYILCRQKFRKIGMVHVATEDGSGGYRGIVTDLLRHNLGKKHPAKVVKIYTCGPHDMLYEVIRIAKRYKIQCEVLLEGYMACGFGICLGCAVETKTGYRFVCKDGPVFDAEELI